MATKPRGLRCAACQHLIATTREWLTLSRSKTGSRMYCHECADDIESFIRTLEREHTTARQPSSLKLRRLAVVALDSGSGI